MSLIHKGLACDPDERYPDAAAMAGDLQHGQLALQLAQRDRSAASYSRTGAPKLMMTGTT